MQYNLHRKRRVACTEKQLQRGLCSNPSSHSFLNHAYNANSTAKHLQVVYPRQYSDAILYSSLVVFFYAAIIMIVVGTNCHRFKKQHNSAERTDRRTTKHLLTMTDSGFSISHIILKKSKPPAQLRTGAVSV